MGLSYAYKKHNNFIVQAEEVKDMYIIGIDKGVNWVREK
ncbi:hypothetical protein DESME_13245 [Desulfitobacterium metallireducens DSM 15288]|uniref:Uncharacterized protein n=1 Tax=Desulfitobacterium metallireducens DSM 15288 TaxID=871968 RepID=W0ED49_9FIRM|nr:hypothetical protein DESME_13245 [Desulfitobacterium metallireducens DSM 15288]